jgi:selenocysteine-specific elongation factor
MFLQVIENLKNLETGDLEKLILTYLNEAKYRGLSKKIIRTFTNNFSQNLENTLKTLQETGKIHLINKDNSHYVHNDYIEELCPKIISFLKSFHASYPLLSGISKEELKSKLLPFSGYDLFNFILQFLEEKMLIALDQHLVRLKTHKIRLTQQEKQIKVKIYHLLSTVKYSPPSPKEIAQILKVNEEKIRQLLRLLIEEKKVVRIKEDFYFGAESIERLKNALINYLKTHGGITPAEFKRLTDASRKYNIALLEYFDYIKLTLRLEDKRILR